MTLQPKLDLSPVVSDEIRRTTCYMCACRCGIRVHLVEGDQGPEVRYIDGNPDHPLNQGVICAKGSAGIMKQYSPARLTQPLLRKPGSERGAGKAACFSALASGLTLYRELYPLEAFGRDMTPETRSWLAASFQSLID